MPITGPALAGYSRPAAVRLAKGERITFEYVLLAASTIRG